MKKYVWIWNESVTTNYLYSENKLVLEDNPAYSLNFLYDENELLYIFIKNTSEKYFYIRDVYQSILGIMDNTGAIVVKYSCDAWGNHIVLDSNGNENTSDSFIGNINPFRYKGYYYDKETNLYLVTTRYYNPKWCRFLNADSIEYLDPSNINGMICMLIVITIQLITLTLMDICNLIDNFRVNYWCSCRCRSRRLEGRGYTIRIVEQVLDILYPH